MLAVLRRRWWVILCALAVGALVAAQLWVTPGVYWASTKLVLQAPTRPEERRLAPTSVSLVAMAGVLEAVVNVGRPLPRSASAGVSLVDQGITDGARVRVPNYGGQWANNYSESTLIVEASGPSEAVVRGRIDDLTGRVQTHLRAFQDTLAVPSGTRITIVAFPAPVVQYSDGRRTLAIAVLTALVVAAGCALAVVVDRLVLGHRGARR